MKQHLVRGCWRKLDLSQVPRQRFAQVQQEQQEPPGFTHGPSAHTARALLCQVQRISKWGNGPDPNLV